MKIKLLLLISILYFGEIYAQSNRYSTVTTSSYTPDTSVNIDYYKAMAERNRAIAIQKQENIAYNIQKLDDLTTAVLKMDIDNELREKMYEVRSYLKKLGGQMSLNAAEKYVNRAYKIYNKSISKYYKRKDKAIN